MLRLEVDTMKYVVAVRREARGLASLADIVMHVAGLQIGPSDRALIDVTPQVADELKRRYGDSVIVEPEIRHDRL
jgi:hypothetical protein